MANNAKLKAGSTCELHLDPKRILYGFWQGVSPAHESRTRTKHPD